MQKAAVITGASSGIGEATAIKLAQAGYFVYLGARREDKVKELAGKLSGVGMYLDVTDGKSVEEFCEQIPSPVHVLVNNAGGAIGLEPIAESIDDHWMQMYQANVLGLMRMTRGLLPNLKAERGHIVNITSIAGREVYVGGAGYTAVKHAARAVTETLRLELNGLPIRVTDIAPGMVKTNFSKVRFLGDEKRADDVYRGVTPLTADDIADAICWCVTRPEHVNIDEMVIRPLAQAQYGHVARDKGL